MTFEEIDARYRAAVLSGERERQDEAAVEPTRDDGEQEGRTS